MLELLRTEFDASIVNPTGINEKVLIIWRHQRRTNGKEVSFGFSLSGKPKCWATERVKVNDIHPIGDIGREGSPGPKLHPDYGEFTERGLQFHPYSIKAIPADNFKYIEQTKEECDKLHVHLVGEE